MTKIEYRYRIISETPIMIYPYIIIDLLDTETNKTIQKSAWEIICNDKFLKEVDWKDLALLCAAAVSERVKYELVLRNDLIGFSILEEHTNSI